MAAGSRRGGAATSKRSRASSSSSPALLGRGSSSRSNGARGGGAAAAVDGVGDGSDFDAGDLECASLPEDSWFGADEAAAAAGSIVQDDSAAAGAFSAAPLSSAPPAQAFALSATPLYPNSVKWSEDNLLAVAAGHMVTILSPASLSGPRSFVSMSSRPSFDFGTVNRDELKHHMMLPLTLCRDPRAVVRSIDWSPQGVGSNGGCLLAVATTDHRVKLYSPPMSEYRSEWVEVADLSDHMFGYCMKYEFLESEMFDMMTERLSPKFPVSRGLKRQAPEPLSPLENSSQDSMFKRRRTSNSGAPELSMLSVEAGNSTLLPAAHVLWDGQAASSNHIKTPFLNDVLPEDVMKIFQKRGRRGILGEPFSGVDVEGFDVSPSGGIKQNKRKKQLKTRDGNVSNFSVTAPQYMLRSSIMASLVLAWSPKCSFRDENLQVTSSVFLAVGTKSGMVGFWRIMNPGGHSVEKVLPLQNTCFIGFLNAHESWVTVLDWAVGDSGDDVLLATGSSDGSVKVWQGDTKMLMGWQSSTHFIPWKLLIQVTGVDSVPVTSLAVKLPSQALLLAVGKGSGSVLAWELTNEGVCTRKADLACAHDQAVMGICWTLDGSQFYSCGQDNMLQLWSFTDTQLVAVSTAVLASEVPATAPDLPASALESFYGVVLSPANLALAMVRGIAAEAVDPMYQSRSQKGVVQLLWVGQDDMIVKDQSFDDPFAARSAYAIAASWEGKIISALSYIERRVQSFVLWDVLTVLSFLKGICGGEILASVFQKWLSSWNFVNTGAAEVCCWSTDDVKNCLPSLSCRCLQIVVVIFRRILLQDMKLGLFTEGLEAMLSSGTRTQLTPEQQSWLDILWCVEHELRERLMLLALLTALWCKSPQAENAQASAEVQERLPTALLMSDWITLNPSKVSCQLLQLAMEVHKAYNRSDQSNTHERCSFCEQTVPLEYLEVGYCRAEGINTRVNHRLQRCTSSMQICPPGPSWFCTCCGRNAFQQVPEFFFSLTSRLQIERLPSIVVLQPVVPRCPFCGILMQRILPEFFLTPALI